MWVAFGRWKVKQLGFVYVLFEEGVDAVVADIELAAYEPFPERRMAGVQRGVPVMVPIEKLGVFAKTFGEVCFAEALHDGRVVEICLPDKFRGRAEVFLFFPVHRDLRFILAVLRFAVGLGGGLAGFGDGHGSPWE